MRVLSDSASGDDDFNDGVLLKPRIESVHRKMASVTDAIPPTLTTDSVDRKSSDINSMMQLQDMKSNSQNDCASENAFENDRSSSLPNLTNNDSYTRSNYSTCDKIYSSNSLERLHAPSPYCSPVSPEMTGENSKLLHTNSSDEFVNNLGTSLENCHLLAGNSKISCPELSCNSPICDNVLLDATSRVETESAIRSIGNGQQIGVAVSVNPENSRLSTVLENIPLVYIPHSRVLSVQTDNSSARSSIPSSSLSSELNSSSYENDKTDDAIPNLNAENVENPPPNTGLERVANSSRVMTDASPNSSMSSLSTGTDYSLPPPVEDDGVVGGLKLTDVDLTDDAEFVEINLHSRNTFEKAPQMLEELRVDDEVTLQAAKGKRNRVISSFLSKNLFTKRARDQSKVSDPSSPLGWKLFGKVPPKQTATVKDATQISEEYQARHRLQMLSPIRCRKKDVEVLSTTALILENRPMNLPSKAPEEELRHRLEYEGMVEAAKKKELKELKLKKKQMQHQLRIEDQLAASLRIWNNQILPNWENTKESKKARDLWWQGIPPSVRGRVWKLAVGNDLNLTHELYEICLGRAQDYLKLLQQCCENGEDFRCNSKEASVDVIRLDVSRTFPQLKVFQKGGPYYDMLHSLLGAYTSYRPDVGYVQGMSFLAAVLLLNMDVADAFICFANLLNKPCQVAFFRIDETLMKAYFQAYEEFFLENLPKLYAHFKKYNLSPDLYIIDWIFTLYSKSLPLDVASRVWDVFCRDGEEFLFRTALGILRMFEAILFNLDFIHLAQFLTKLPENISAEQLFKNVDHIKMQIDKRKFSNVLTTKKDQLLLEKERESTDGTT